MPEEPSLQDVLPYTLQSAVDKKLTLGEAVLMALTGAQGEALVVTDRRVIITREQMPIVSAETEVDCFDYQFELISTVRVDGAVGGGHLTLVLTTPPLDDKAVTLYFPSYDLAKFDGAAARIRLLAGQTRSVPVGLVESVETDASPHCMECGANLTTGSNHCPQCGTATGSACGYCSNVLPRAARFCPSCGTSSEHARVLKCRECGEAVSAFHSYCPHCGLNQLARCSQCGRIVLAGWRRCAGCGRALDSIPTVPAPNTPTETPLPRWNPGEEQNAEGMRLYNEEEYEEAILKFRAALEIEPSNPLFHCNLGVALAELGEDEEALNEYETARKLAPADPTPWLNLGYFHSERENQEAADAAWRKVLELAPNSSAAEEARQNLKHADEL